jgi:sugar lactone lactonase YvrE
MTSIVGKRSGILIVTVLVVVLMLGWVPNASGQSQVDTVVTFDAEASQLPEGVAVDADGNVFVSWSPLGELVKVAAGSDTAQPFGGVEGLMEGDPGLLGLATDADGNVYGGVVSTNPDANGVWKFDAETGDAERIKGSEGIMLANAIAFDEDGTMYVTDSIAGAVWRVKEGEPAELWIQDALLEGDGSFGYPFPIGANGIAVGGDHVYVAVTETGLIVAIPVADDGSAGSPSVWSEMEEGVLPDGLTIDGEGHLYIAAPTVNQILRVHEDGTVETLAEESDGLDAPSSLIYARDEDGNGVLYAVNYSIAIAPPGGAGPALLKIPLGA